MTVDQWSRTKADNSQIARQGWPENMNRSAVNNQARDGMASVRSLVEDGEWVNHLDEFNNTFTPSASGALDIIISDGTGSNATSKFRVGDLLRITGTDGDSSNTRCIAEVTVIGSYGTPSGAITLTVKNPLLAMGDTPTLADTTDLPDAGITLVEHFWSRTTKEAALHPVGTTTGGTPTQLLAIDDLGSTDAIDELNAASGLDADLLEGLPASTFALADSVSRNVIINPSFRIWQRGTSFTAAADDTMTADGWKLLRDSAGYNVQRVATGAGLSGWQWSIKLTAAGNNSKAGILHVVENEDTIQIVRNGRASLTYWVILPVGGGIDQIRAGIINNIATKDAGLSDPVTVWNNSSTNPTIHGDWGGGGYANTPANDEHTARDDTWTKITIENVAIGASTVNLGVFLWIQSTSQSTNDFVHFGGVKLEPGAVATTDFNPGFAGELQACQRRFVTTYDYGVAPGSSPSIFAGQLNHPSSEAINFGASQCHFDFRFPVTMLKIPTVTVYTPDDGAEGVALGSTDNDLDTVAENIGANGCTLTVTENPTVAQEITVHATASAEPTA